MMPEHVASVSLIILTATGEELQAEASVGLPYRSATGEWRCPVRLDDLHETLPDIAGEDSLQALCLAASLLRSLLEDVIEKGGRVLCADRSEYPIAAIFAAVSRPSDGSAA
jgi:Domain of unknown function (DUF6968)